MASVTHLRATTGRHDSDDSRGRVLTKAVLRATEIMALSHSTLARILGVSPASISRLAAPSDASSTQRSHKSGSRLIDPDSKEGELALIFLRIFRSLDSLVGGTPHAVSNWLNTSNQHLGQQAPLDLLQSVTGIVRVANYLDAFRGRA